MERKAEHQFFESLFFFILLYFNFKVNTHVHADHVTGSGRLKKHLQHVKSIIGVESKAKADIHVKDGDLTFENSLKII